MEIKLNINSEIDRQPSDTRTEFTTWLNDESNNGGIEGFNKLSIRLNDIELPNSSYNFPYYASRLYYSYNGGATDFIEIDYYRLYKNATDLASEIQNKFSNKSINVTVSFDDNTKKINITNDMTDPLKIFSSRIYEDVNENLMYYRINLRIGLTQDLTNTELLNGDTLVGDNMVRMIRTQCYYLVCDQLGEKVEGGQQYMVPNPSLTNIKILGRITASSFGTLSQISDYANTIEYILNTKSLKKLSFRLLDDELMPIHLNGYPLTFSVIIKGE